MAFWSIILLIAKIAVSEELSQEEEIQEQNLRRLGYANNYLGMNLHKAMSTNSEENVFFSPFTISSVLSMLYIGAKSETAAELRTLLGFHRIQLNDSVIFSTYRDYLTEFLGKLDSNSYTINCASAMVVDRSFPLIPSYKAEVQDIYQAYVQEANFAHDTKIVKENLNSWASIATGGMISNLVDSIDPATILFLASAAYFKGSWRVKFEPENTKYHLFYNGGQRYDGKNVLMMHTASNFRYYYDQYKRNEFTAVEMAYEGKNMSMIIILPEYDDGLPDIEQDITPAKIALIRRYMYYTKVHLTMPKFKLEFNRDISEYLQSLGLSKIFGSGADFSGMTEKTSDLILNEVRHKAVVDVNEKGSTAAAVSSVMMMKMIPQNERTPEFKVDHPFLFVIIDTRSNMIFFMGRVNRL